MDLRPREGFQVLALVYRDKSAYHHHLLIAVWFLPFVSSFFPVCFAFFLCLFLKWVHWSLQRLGSSLVSLSVLHMGFSEILPFCFISSLSLPYSNKHSTQAIA